MSRACNAALQMIYGTVYEARRQLRTHHPVLLPDSRRQCRVPILNLVGQQGGLDHDEHGG